MVVILQVEISRNSNPSTLFNKGVERGCRREVENEEAKWAGFCAFIMKRRTIRLFKPCACINLIKIKINF